MRCDSFITSPARWSGTRRLRVAAASALVALGLLACAGGASAAIDLGAGEATPSVVYDPGSGYTYVAWTDPSSDDTIDLCALPKGATVCNGGGPYKLTDPAASSGGAGPVYFGYRVLVMPGGTVVVVANVDGAGSSALGSYTSGDGVIAWSSPAGGEAFGKAGQGIADSGKLLAENRGEIPAQGALALDSTHILVYGDLYPFSSGATVITLGAQAPKETPLVDHTEEFGIQLSTDSPQLAVEEDPAKSGEFLVVTVGSDDDTPKECPGGSEEGTGYGVAKAKPEELQKQPAWKTGYFKVIACRAEQAVIAGGGLDHATIGVVELEGTGLNGSGEDSVDFRPFSAGSEAFGAPVTISQEAPFTIDGADDVSASEDSGGGLYALWGDKRGFELSYSDTQGTSWMAPVTALSEASDPVVAGVDGGVAEIAYHGNFGNGEQEYLEPVNYTQLYEAQNKPAPAPAPTPTPKPTAISTTQSGGGVSGATITVPQGTSVSDLALLSGANAAGATGTVTYNVWKNDKCTVAAGAGSVQDVSKGVAGASSAVRLAPGTYYWTASYSGDANDDGATSRCGSEVLTVALNATTLGLPSSHECLSKRHFLVHPRAPRGVKLVSVEVQINGRFVKRVRLSDHATTVSLVGLPKGTFKVALITTSSKGKVYEEVRTFHTCVPGKHKTKK